MPVCCNMFLFSTGLHLGLSGSVELPGLRLDAAALSLSQQRQHHTGRHHPDSPAALPEAKLRRFALYCITHQFCLMEGHARIPAMHWEDTSNQSHRGIKPMTWLLRASCSTHWASWASTAHTNWRLKQVKYRCGLTDAFSLDKTSQSVCFAVVLLTPDAR